LRYRENASRGKRLLAESRIRVGAFVLLLILSFSCLSLWGVRQKNPLADGLSFALTPLQSAVSQWVGRGEDQVLSWKELMGVRQQAEHLREENRRLRRELALLHGVESENRRLRRLHRLAEQQPWEAIPADVIGWGEEHFRTLLLNRGSVSGVTDSQPVITYAGLVGRVLAVQPHACLVLEITDPNSAVGVFAAPTPDEASGEVVLGVVSGSGLQELLFEPQGGKEVAEGLSVYTSATSTIYPAGLLVGWVRESVESSYTLQARLRVEPAVDFAALREALILTGLHRQEAVNLAEQVE